MQATFAHTLVDEWVRDGVVDAVVSPGSRSTPLALALAQAAGAGLLRLHVRLDERSAGFFALGCSLATGQPTLVLTTSGTAALELHPAVAEAGAAGVPLLACTADRPPELHDVGAPQTLEQWGAFGGSTRFAAAPGVARAEAAGTWRSLAARAVAEARGWSGRPGPVHLNLAFVDPLVADPGPLPPPRVAGAWHRSGAGASGSPPADALPAGVPYVGRSGPGTAHAAVDPGLVRRLAARRRGLFVVGAGAGDPDVLHAAATALGWPVVPDPRSGARREGPATVAMADAILRSEPARAAFVPEVVVRVGAPWASKVLGSWLASLPDDTEQLVVSADGQWRDPDRRAAEVLATDPTAFLALLAQAADPAGPEGRASDWLEAWRTVEVAASGAIDELLGRLGPAGGEPALARSLYQALGPDDVLVVASSMPVRDLEWFGPACPAGELPPIVVANRGVNGIDGTIATALGVAAARARGRVVALLGDLAFFHDAGSLVRLASEGVDAGLSGGSGPADRGLAESDGGGSAGGTDGVLRRGPSVAAPLTLVVVDNGGGGIFSFLPQAAALRPERFELLFGTPPAADVLSVAAGYGVEAVALVDPRAVAAELADSPGAVRVVRFGSDRRENVACHDELARAAVTAVDRVLTASDPAGAPGA